MVKQRTKPTQSGYGSPIQPEPRFSAIPSAFEPRAAELVPQPPAHPSGAATQLYLIQWLRSGRNLDFCLLAICSCILTLLCHHAPTSLHTSSTLGGSVNSTPIANLSRIDFTIKAGLFSRFSESEESEQEN
ncbi:hypothetical protein [Egbenema bharatensis]|uniref:hypothetical protein n=1 Tax=Egbenema bharatensis TaxID=3463334 RepID=UPI003A8AF105